MEVLGLVLGLTGPAQQAVEAAARLRERCQSYRTSAATATDMAETYDRLAAHLRALARSCEDNVYSFPRDNAAVLTDAVDRLRNTLVDAVPRIDVLLRNLNSRFFRFTHASRTEVQLAEMREEASRSLVNVGQINTVLATAAVVRRNTEAVQAMHHVLVSLREMLPTVLQLDTPQMHPASHKYTVAVNAEASGAVNTSNFVAAPPSITPYPPPELRTQANPAPADLAPDAAGNLVDRAFYFDVFISAADVEGSPARPLRDALAAEGLRVFLYDHTLHVSSLSIYEQLTAAMRGSKGAIFILTPHFVARMWTMYELMYFLQLKDRATEEGREPPLLIPLFYRLSVLDCLDPQLPYRTELVSIFRENGFFRMERQRICTAPQAMEVLKRLTGFLGLRNDHQESAEEYAQRAATRLIRDLRVGLSLSTDAGEVREKKSVTYDVFIVYSWRDKHSITYPLCKALQDAGLCCFFDDEDVLASRATVDEQFKDAMKRSKTAVFVLSANFVARRYPMFELRTFLELWQEARRQGQEPPRLVPLYYKLTLKECRDAELPYHPKYMSVFEAHGFFEDWRQRECSTVQAMDALRRLTDFVGVNSAQDMSLSDMIEETRNMLTSTSSGTGFQGIALPATG